MKVGMFFLGCLFSSAILVFGLEAAIAANNLSAEISLWAYSSGNPFISHISYGRFVATTLEALVELFFSLVFFGFGLANLIAGMLEKNNGVGSHGESKPLIS